MRIQRSIAWAMALAFSSGCHASRTQYTWKAPVLSSPNFDQEQSLERLKPAQLKAVSLHDILAYADAHSPLLGVSRAELQLGEAAIRGASPRFTENPKVNVAIGPRKTVSGSGVDLSLGITQEVEVNGARGLAIEAAQRWSDEKTMQLNEARWHVHQQVHKLFHQALIAKEQRVLRAKRLKFAEALVAIAKRRLSAGDISPLGLRVAQSEFAQAKQSKVAADGAFVSAQLLLAEAAGWPSSPLPMPAGRIETPRKTPSVEGLIALAKERNPQLFTRVAATRRAQARMHLAEGKKWGNPEFGIQYNRESDTTAGLGAAEASILLFSVSLPVPLWNKNTKARARAEAEMAVENARFHSQKQSLPIRVLRAANQVNVAAERITAFGSEILPNMESNLNLLQKAFELGEIDILDVTVAERRFLELQESALSAYYEYYQASSLLEQVVGAEVWPEERHDEGDKE